MDYLRGLLNVGGVMVAPFGEELVRVEVGEEEKGRKTLTLFFRCSISLLFFVILLRGRGAGREDGLCGR